MKWIGITGGLGSGKSTVAKYLREAGYSVLDADQIARSVLGPDSSLLKPIREKFGNDVFNPDGSLDRKALGQKVFVSKKDLAWLESIVHPEVQRKVRELRAEFESKNEELAFYDVPLLFEKGLEKNFDAVVVVSSSRSLMQERVAKRDGLSESEIQDRMANQWPLEKKVQNADFVLSNDGDLSELKEKVQDLLSQLRSQL